MHAWVGRTVRLVSAATLVYACAGKSISNTDDDGDSGVGGSGNVGYSGKGGGISVGGKGGSPGKGGTTGKGGVGGTIATGGKGGVGIGGSNVAGEPGIGGEPGCGGRFVGQSSGTCLPPPSCISMVNPTPAFVRRNQLVEPGFPEGGQGGEAGSSNDLGDAMATAILCGNDEGFEGFLSFEYFMPEDRAPIPPITLLTGDRACQGEIIASGRLTEFQRPPAGWWSKQCLRVSGAELGGAVTVAVPRDTSPFAHVRNLAFVTQCECPRQLLRYDTCGDYTSVQECF